MKIRWEDYIGERKDVMLGKPVFKGTRLTVEHVLNELGVGATTQDLLDNYPTLKAEHIRAAMLYAAAVLTMDACESSGFYAFSGSGQGMS